MQEEWDKKKVIILISSIFTWARTPVQYKKEAGEGGEEAEEGAEGEKKEEEPPEEESEEEKEEPGEEGKEEPVEQQEEAEKKKKILAFKESQYYLRVPDPNYDSHKFLETLALSIGIGKPVKKPEDKKLLVYVLCAGLLYGKEEDVFYEYFKRAWLQKPEKLPYIGKGLNLVPTIHIVDLSRLIRRIIKLKPQISYIVAVDRTKKPTQKKLVTAISKAIGTNKVEQLPIKELMKEKWMLPLQIGIKIRPSEVFKDEPAPGDEGELEPEEQERRAKARKFPWQCELGIPENIAQLNIEFNKARDLNPVKIFVTAPPAAGKAWLCQQYICGLN